ncbi:MAG TPA: FilE, partial [Acinetobacter radioresistens]|nr:FilE [Acinetobacter radioresistens]
ASMIHFKKLEGVIRIPVHTQYLLMTPLLSAPDTPNYVLSNQGQLKLIALR